MKGTEAYLFGIIGLATVALGVWSFVRWRNILTHEIVIE